MSRLEQLLSRSNMRNKVLNSLDASSLSAMRETDSASVLDALRYPIHYDWREETDAERIEREELERIEREERERIEIEEQERNPFMPPPLGLRRERRDGYYILDHETSTIAGVIFEEDLLHDWNGTLRQRLTKKSNNELIPFSDITNIDDHNSIFRLDEDTGIILYNKGPLAGQKILFDENLRVIIHTIRNSYAAEGRKSRKSNRPKSKKSCKKRHMKWNSNTKRCNKKSK